MQVQMLCVGLIVFSGGASWDKCPDRKGMCTGNVQQMLWGKVIHFQCLIITVKINQQCNPFIDSYSRGIK